ncbi:nuclease-related domain-containing protein [Nocardioides renjunii]|uniref:nuclease-related domain-containing protein n=1 Tax=Nocardioides renjunii TaxID=3095075 RepID=UPI002AFEE53E|nr:nuclease-related domain-containing protein [Nocardioides sp. S-34]WQQ22391.1 nuclease-related domain-containing protein [Nocardioides sp. S-34]
MDDAGTPGEKRMRLRYAGACRVCEVALPAKTEAIYERSTKTVRCLGHEKSGVDVVTVEAPISAGTPGGSARREFERREQNRERRIREKHPRLGGLIHAFSDEPQSTKAWDSGALGEERLGSRLNELASDTLRVLHDRTIPGTRANIDHLAVTPTGVFVIDAKKYAGRPHLKVEGGLLRPRVEKLMVGSRNCTKLVDGMLRQIDVVRGMLGDDVAVQGVLCFVEADWPLLGGSFTTRGVEVMWPKKLYPLLRAGDAADVDGVEPVYRRLASALPPA